MIKDERLYECIFCHKKFKRESAFIKHRCEKMKRDESLRTVLGQSALSFYREWLKVQNKRVPDDRAFINSSSYRAFMRFAEYVKKSEMPSPTEFIKLMIKNNYQPSMWHIPEVHTIYMEHLDNAIPPVDLARITVNSLLDLSDYYRCDIGDVFNYTYPGEVIDLMKKRKLSPWILLKSKKFRAYLEKVKKSHPEHFTHLGNMIRVEYWRRKFQKDPKAVETMEKIVKETNL